MSERFETAKTASWQTIALTVIFFVGRFAMAGDEEGDPARRVTLTDQSIRSEKRLYRKAPEGDLYLHIYYPPDWKAEDTRPAIVLFFGGSWKVGSYRQMEPQAEYFASRGLVAVAADYRIFTKHHTTPDKSIEDAKSAMRWVRSHAKELGVDPEKIIAGGGSAGGHLATATALLDDFNAEGDDVSVSCKPCALVLFNPVEDVTHLSEKVRLDLGRRSDAEAVVAHLWLAQGFAASDCVFRFRRRPLGATRQRVRDQGEGNRGEGRILHRAGRKPRIL